MKKADKDRKKIANKTPQITQMKGETDGAAGLGGLGGFSVSQNVMTGQLKARCLG